jgi:hypothetical protein
MVEIKQSGRCGLPGEIKMMDYPSTPFINNTRDDTVTGIMAQIGKSTSKIKSNKPKGK